MNNLQSIDSQFEFAALALAELQEAKTADEKTKLDKVVAILEALLIREQQNADLYGEYQKIGKSD